MTTKLTYEDWKIIDRVLSWELNRLDKLHWEILGFSTTSDNTVLNNLHKEIDEVKDCQKRFSQHYESQYR